MSVSFFSKFDEKENIYDQYYKKHESEARYLNVLTNDKMETDLNMNKNKLLFDDNTKVYYQKSDDFEGLIIFSKNGLIISSSSNLLMAVQDSSIFVNSHRITGLKNPEAEYDAVNRKYYENASNLKNGKIDKNLFPTNFNTVDMGGNKITSFLQIL